MDRALVRFRKAVARANRDRRGVQRRYSSSLQRQAVDYWQARQGHGDGVPDVAAALGVAPWSLHRWIRAWDARNGFQEVRVVTAEPAAAGSRPIVIVDGARVEGLDVPGIVQLLQLLR
jgi:hypothetical protein